MDLLPSDRPLPPARRADAERNRTKILAAAHRAFADSDAPVSMAEVARRAGVGMATLYRNFPGRRELLEALNAEDLNTIREAAQTLDGETPGAVFRVWLHQFFALSTAKRHMISELLTHLDSRDPVFSESRARVAAAGQPLLIAAQQEHEVRQDLVLDQILDLVFAIASIKGDAQYLEPILDSALDGLRLPRSPSRGVQSPS